MNPSRGLLGIYARFGGLDFVPTSGRLHGRDNRSFFRRFRKTHDVNFRGRFVGGFEGARVTVGLKHVIVFDGIRLFEFEDRFEPVGSVHEDVDAIGRDGVGVSTHVDETRGYALFAIDHVSRRAEIQRKRALIMHFFAEMTELRVDVEDQSVQTAVERGHELYNRRGRKLGLGFGGTRKMVRVCIQRRRDGRKFV